MPRPCVLAAILLAVLAATTTASPARASESLHCGDSGYSYAGLLGSALAYGVAADLRAKSLPSVRSGHVAAWVGVGGYGLGRNGTNAWLQAGLITRARGAAVVYYEVTRPGYKPRLVAVRDALAGRSYRVGVLELAQRPGWWRVWVDGRPVTKPISLPGSHGAWEATATARAGTAARASATSSTTASIGSRSPPVPAATGDRSRRRRFSRHPVTASSAERSPASSRGTKAPRPQPRRPGSSYAVNGMRSSVRWPLGSVATTRTW